MQTPGTCKRTSFAQEARGLQVCSSTLLLRKRRSFWHRSAAVKIQSGWRGFKGRELYHAKLAQYQTRLREVVSSIKCVRPSVTFGRCISPRWRREFRRIGVGMPQGSTFTISISANAISKASSRPTVLRAFCWKRQKERRTLSSNG